MHNTWVVAGNPVAGNLVVVDNIDLVVDRIVGVDCSSLQLRRAGHTGLAGVHKALHLGGQAVGRREERFSGFISV